MQIGLEYTMLSFSFHQINVNFVPTDKVQGEKELPTVEGDKVRDYCRQFGT